MDEYRWKKEHKNMDETGTFGKTEDDRQQRKKWRRIFSILFQRSLEEEGNKAVCFCLRKSYFQNGYN